jgi:hypothetical protein
MHLTCAESVLFAFDFAIDDDFVGFSDRVKEDTDKVSVFWSKLIALLVKRNAKNKKWNKNPHLETEPPA